jgi:hypothetical protein
MSDGNKPGPAKVSGTYENDYEAFRIARERVAAHLYIPTGKIEVKTTEDPPSDK